MTHTPRPWRLTESQDGNRWIIEAVHDGGVITHIATVSGPQVLERGRANARLIATAPELLDAGNTLAAYVYSILNPGSIPEHIRSAMRVFENVQP